MARGTSIPCLQCLERGGPSILTMFLESETSLRKGRGKLLFMPPVSSSTCIPALRANDLISQQRLYGLNACVN